MFHTHTLENFVQIKRRIEVLVMKCKYEVFSCACAVMPRLAALCSVATMLLPPRLYYCWNRVVLFRVAFSDMGQNWYPSNIGALSISNYTVLWSGESKAEHFIILKIISVLQSYTHDDPMTSLHWPWAASVRVCPSPPSLVSEAGAGLRWTSPRMSPGTSWRVTGNPGLQFNSNARHMSEA